MSNFSVTNIYLTKLQKDYLKRESKRLGLKSAELVRRILDGYIENDVREKYRNFIENQKENKMLKELKKILSEQDFEELTRLHEGDKSIHTTDGVGTAMTVLTPEWVKDEADKETLNKHLYEVYQTDMRAMALLESYLNVGFWKK